VLLTFCNFFRFLFNFILQFFLFLIRIDDNLYITIFY